MKIDDSKVELLPPGMKFELLTTMERLEMKPGDVLVVTVPGALTDEAAKRLRLTMEDRFDVPVLILSDGVTIGVIGRETC